MGQLGMPELAIILFMSVFWIVPLVAGIWALMTLSVDDSGTLSPSRNRIACAVVRHCRTIV